MNQNKVSPSSDNNILIENKLLEGVVSRAGHLFYIWSYISSLYGILSINLFQKKIVSLSLWDNVWPRLAFTTLPLLLIAHFYKKSHQHTKVKAYLTALITPVFLVIASFVNAWPIIWSGDYDFYYQFHATNIIAMFAGIFYISGSPKLVFIQALSFIAIYFSPLLYLFSKNEPSIFLLILSDTAVVTTILVATQKSIHKLRISLATEDILRREKASLFLGKKLTDAIYENQNMKFEDFSKNGLIMSIDLRGYTKFVQSYDVTTVRGFMSDYYVLVTKVLSTKKAFLHKTIGDGYLISFSLMDIESEVDLSDLPETNKELTADDTKKISSLNQAIEVFLEINNGLEVLSQKYDVIMKLSIGAGCAFGLVDVLTRGDGTYRQEMDIQGSTIIRATRLEAYSKLLNIKIDNESSYLLISPELIEYTNDKQGLKTLLISNPTEQVRDFPDIKMLLYRQWKHNRNREVKLAS